MAFSWTHAMPLARLGTSSKSGPAAVMRDRNGGTRAAAVETPAAARSRRNSRRDGTSEDAGRFMSAAIVSGSRVLASGLMPRLGQAACLGILIVAILRGSSPSMAGPAGQATAPGAAPADESHAPAPVGLWPA